MKTPVAPAAPLDEPALARAVRTLARAEPRFAHIVKRHGPPPLWPRDPGFQTLVLLMLEQQVSLAQGRAMYARIANATGDGDTRERRDARRIRVCARSA